MSETLTRSRNYFQQPSASDLLFNSHAPTHGVQSALVSLQDLVSEADGESSIGRKISVETACSGTEGHRSVGRRRRHHHRRDRKARSTNDLDAAGCDETDSRRTSGQTIRRNLSTSMTLADLRDGVFTAEFPLDALSPVGDIRIRVAGTCLDMFVVDDGVTVDGGEDDDGGIGCNRRKSDCGAGLARKDVKDKSGSVTPNDDKSDRRRSSHAGTTGKKKTRNGGSSRGVAKYLGTVDLPIYVDAGRLRFDVDRNGRTAADRGSDEGMLRHRKPLRHV
jgi:hypothetical protein